MNLPACARPLKAVAVALLLSWPLAARAEVALRTGGGLCPSFLVMAIVEDADPIGSKVWQPFSTDPDVVTLNPSGALRGDGTPDVAFEDSNCGALLVWSYVSGESTDLMLTEWVDPISPVTRTLTYGPQADLDPRLFLEDGGTLHVAWWTDGATPAVRLLTRAALSSRWSAPLTVSAPSEAGRRPSVAVAEGVLRVAYERDSLLVGFSREVVVATRQPDGSFAREVLARTVRASRLDPILHAEGTRLWVDWKEDGTLAYSVLEPSGWSAPALEPWPDPSWVGVAEARAAIRRRVLSE